MSMPGRRYVVRRAGKRARSLWYSRKQATIRSQNEVIDLHLPEGQNVIAVYPDNFDGWSRACGRARTLNEAWEAEPIPGYRKLPTAP